MAATLAMEMSSSHRPPVVIASRMAVAATRPVVGSVTASAQNSGPSGVEVTSPPAAAASSPKATRSRPAPVRPCPVIDAHTRGEPVASIRSGSMPKRSSARSLDPSMTTSARATTSRSSLIPSSVRRSIERLSLAALSRSKKAGGPSRAPSGRDADSTLMTLAPAAARNDPHNGPAHSELRSTTVSPARSATRRAGPGTSTRSMGSPTVWSWASVGPRSASGSASTSASPTRRGPAPRRPPRKAWGPGPPGDRADRRRAGR